MLPYWILFGLAAAGAVQSGSHKEHLQRSHLMLRAFGLFVLLMVGLRYEVGGDWQNYIIIFEDLRRLSLTSALPRGDPGYVLLNWLAAGLGYGVGFINLVCAAIFSWGLVRFAWQQPSPWLAMVVAVPYLVIVVAMGYTRQAVAIGILMAGLSTLRANPSLIRFGFYVVAAALFHKTAIILLPLVALASTRNRWSMLAFGALLSVMLFYLFLSASADMLVINYVQQEYDAQGALVRVVMNVLPAAIFLMAQNRFSFDEMDRRLWRNFALASGAALLGLFLLRSSVVVDRLALYLIPMQLAVLSRLPYALSRKPGMPSPLLTLAVIAYAGLVQLVWLTAADNADYWLPYRTWLG